MPRDVLIIQCTLVSHLLTCFAWHSLGTLVIFPFLIDISGCKCLNLRKISTAALINEYNSNNIDLQTSIYFLCLTTKVNMKKNYNFVLLANINKMCERNHLVEQLRNLDPRKDFSYWLEQSQILVIIFHEFIIRFVWTNPSSRSLNDTEL